jgi:phage baseplate assembly protein W
MARTTRTYSDIDFAFSRAANGDLSVKYDENAVKQSIRNLVLTANYERPFHPEIGCQVYNQLFENFTPITVTIIRQTVYNVLLKFEPRILVLNIDVDSKPDYNSLGVTVTFRFTNDPRPITVTTFLNRVR